MVNRNESLGPRVEDVKELPVLGAWIERMELGRALDEVLGPPHGNWEGASPGTVLVGFLLYVVSERDHCVVSVEEWVRGRLETLRHVLGAEITVKDFTDDRILSVLGKLGEEEARRWERLDVLVGRHLISAYRLPTETGRADTSSFVMYHGEGGGLAQFGHSKDRRPDLRQFKAMLGTLDPAGLPLVTEVLPGGRADDGEYVAAWERMVEVLGGKDWVLVADCKFASVGNRAQVARKEGLYYAPMPRTGEVPELLREWVLAGPEEMQELRLSDWVEGEESNWWGLERTRRMSWQDPTTGEEYRWDERWCLVRSMTWAEVQWRGFTVRLEAAEKELRVLGEAPGEEVKKVRERVAEILKRQGVGEYLQVRVEARARYRKKYEGRGRPGPQRRYRRVRYYEISLRVERVEEKIEEFQKLTGWRVYVTNATKERVSLVEGVERYRGQWQPERGFHRWKRGELPVVPLYLRDDDRIRGLVVMMGLALRLLTLMEYVVQERLGEEEATLSGVYDSHPRRVTPRPTAGKMLKAFGGIHRCEVRQGDRVEVYVTPLNACQKRILELMGLSETIYTGLARSVEKFDRGP